MYPATPLERNQWIIQHRSPKNIVDYSRPYAFLFEEEIVSTATIFITNRECPFRCLMCDLWRNTLDERVPPGAIAMQIRFALDRLPPARQVKLYNSGNFFDPQAIPPEDYAEIAETISGFERVIVESHPAFLQGKYGQNCLDFYELIKGRLEIAIGLETVHTQTLELLNKRMTIDQFQRAAQFLEHNDIDLRAFILLRPPFLTEEEGLYWACRSLDFAIDCGAAVCSLIPTRGGNGAIEALGESFAMPRLRSLEAAQEYGLSKLRARVFSDLWDIEKFYDCGCSARRASRLAAMNRTQSIAAKIECPNCT